MNITFIIPGLGFGGAERVVSVLANEMVNRGHNVEIIMSSGEGTIAYELSPQVRVERADVSCGLFSRWWGIRKCCTEFKADVVLAFMGTTGILSSCFLAGTGIPVISSERNDPTQQSRRLSLPLRLLGFCSKFLIKGYVFQSEGAKSYYPKTAQKKSAIILNPLDLHTLPERDENNIEDKIVTVGRLHPQKNHRLLIEAFVKSKFYRDHTLHIYGDGDLKDELLQLIESLGASSKVVLEGNVSGVQERIKNAKLFVFTSDYEGLPNALMEAMAIGIPCISTDCSPGGARMLIQNEENGILIPCGDTQALTDELDALYNDIDFCKKLGSNSKKIRANTGVENITNQWLNYINSVL